MIASTSWAWALGVGCLTGISTLIGGAVTLRFRSAANLLLGFSSGAVIGVALFDLLLEALEAGRLAFSPLAITTATGIGFAAYLALDRLPHLLKVGHTAGTGLWPASLTAHSLMDGFGIGVAFHASTAVGWGVALAVLAHDFFDGANTVTLSLDGGGSYGRARRRLLADAVAQLIGISLSKLVSISQGRLSLLLGLFSGFPFISAGVSFYRGAMRNDQESRLLAPR